MLSAVKYREQVSKLLKSKTTSFLCLEGRITSNVAVAVDAFCDSDSSTIWRFTSRMNDVFALYVIAASLFMHTRNQDMTNTRYLKKIIFCFFSHTIMQKILSNPKL